MNATPKIAFQINYAKAIEAILYVLSKRKSVNMYNLLKVIFEADKFHLNASGRPVTGDTYIKMEHGTVPSAIYDVVKGDPIGLAELDVEVYPFMREGVHLVATREPNLDHLSESDLEALNHGISQYLELGFHEVKEKNHLEKCWIESELNRPIDFEKMIENKEILELLQNGLRLVV